jgi:hypothetical protein
MNLESTAEESTNHYLDVFQNGMMIFIPSPLHTEGKGAGNQA